MADVVDLDVVRAEADAKAAADRAEAIRLAMEGQHTFDPRWIRDEQDVRAVLDGCWFSESAAQRPVYLIETYLRHARGRHAGDRFALLDWEMLATLTLFGWQRADGTRRYRRGFIFIPKKNGKSMFLAAIQIYMMLGDGEIGADVACVAVDRDQASLIFDAAAAMIRLSPELSAAVTIVDSSKTILHPASGSRFRALSANSGKHEGLDLSSLAFDELHVQKNRTLWDVVKYAGSARRQPLALAITTAGVYDPGSVCWQEYNRAKKILSGQIIDWAYFAMIFEAGEHDDWTDPATWAKANPSFGKTLDPATFAEECHAAKDSAPDENSFRRYRLNQWTQQVTRWIPLHIWDANQGHQIDAAALVGQPCYGGLDLGSVSDLTALAWMFRCASDPTAFDVVARFWIPENSLRNQKNPNLSLYLEWAAKGLLATTPGDVTDFDFVEAAVLEDAKTYDVRGVALDRLFQGQSVSNHLTDQGVPMVEFGQGFLSMGPACKTFERSWRALKIHHGSHPILRWMADNTEVKADPAGNLKIVKPNNHMDPRKVDGIVALVMAGDQWERQPIVKRSVYDDPNYQPLTIAW